MALQKKIIPAQEGAVQKKTIPAKEWKHGKKQHLHKGDSVSKTCTSKRHLSLQSQTFIYPFSIFVILHFISFVLLNIFNQSKLENRQGQHLWKGDRIKIPSLTKRSTRISNLADYNLKKEERESRHQNNKIDITPHRNDTLKKTKN